MESIDIVRADITVRPRAGASIEQVLQSVCSIARSSRAVVSLQYGVVWMSVKPGTTVEVALREFKCLMAGELVA